MNTHPHILSGRIIKEEKTRSLATEVSALTCVPRLAIIQVGDRPDSSTYVLTKRAYAEKIGATTEYIHLDVSVTQDEVIHIIKGKNGDAQTHGIIVQLPLPEHLDRAAIVDCIDPTKDVDGLTTVNQDKMTRGDATGIVPATARGVMELMRYYRIELKGKKVAVVGRSRLVGAPIAWMCKNGGADVIVCHSQTPDLAHETGQADILIVAVGKAGLITDKYIKQGAVVIDVGINRTANGTLVGDVDHVSAVGVASAITPVPGGVGQMTVVALFENLIDACRSLCKR